MRYRSCHAIKSSACSVYTFPFLLFFFALQPTLQATKARHPSSNKRSNRFAKLAYGGKEEAKVCFLTLICFRLLSSLRLALEAGSKRSLRRARNTNEKDEDGRGRGATFVTCLIVMVERGIDEGDGQEKRHPSFLAGRNSTLLYERSCAPERTAFRDMDWISTFPTMKERQIQ